MKIYFIILFSLGLLSACNEAEVSKSESSVEHTDVSSAVSTEEIDSSDLGESYDEWYKKRKTIELEQAFPQLKWIDVHQDDMLDTRFGYSADSFSLIQKRLENLPEDDVRYDAQNDEKYILVGEYQNDNMTEAVNILYSDGPSIDPHFIISDKNNQTMWMDAADNFAILDNGLIYTSGNTNRMYHRQMKFKITKGKIKELAQPFYYVGNSGKLLKPISLYSQKSGGEVVASLPIGTEVEVLLAERIIPQEDEYTLEIEKNYLVRTPFGLVGWLRLSDDDTYSDPVINFLRFMGD